MTKSGKIVIKDKCYICDARNNAIPSDWYSMWYDGKQRNICSIKYRQDILDLCEAHPEKTYSQNYELTKQ